MFVRLTRKDDGGEVYINAAQVRGVSEERDVTWVYVGKNGLHGGGKRKGRGDAAGGGDERGFLR